MNVLYKFLLIIIIFASVHSAIYIESELEPIKISTQIDKYTIEITYDTINAKTPKISTRILTNDNMTILEETISGNGENLIIVSDNRIHSHDTLVLEAITKSISEMIKNFSCNNYIYVSFVLKLSNNTYLIYLKCGEEVYEALVIADKVICRHSSVDEFDAFRSQIQDLFKIQLILTESDMLTMQSLIKAESSERIHDNKSIELDTKVFHEDLIKNNNHIKIMLVIIIPLFVSSLFYILFKKFLI